MSFSHALLSQHSHFSCPRLDYSTHGSCQAAAAGWLPLVAPFASLVSAVSAITIGDLHFVSTPVACAWATL